MQTTYPTVDFLGKKHTVRRCTLDDIDNHFSKVKDLIPEEEHEAYKNRMQISVGANFAFCIDDDCFIYMRKNRPCLADAFSLYGKNAPLKTLAMFACILINIDKRLLKIEFFLHAEKQLEDFKSLIPTYSIRRQAHQNGRVIIRGDYLRGKFMQLYRERGIKWVAH